MSEFTHVDHHYLPHVEAARARVHEDPRIRWLLEDSSATEMLGFLIEFCALGVRMLRPVDGWLRRSARDCLDAGFEELGWALMSASRDEAPRHLLLIDDLVQLSQLWRRQIASDGRSLDLRGLVRREAPASAQRHAVVRETAGQPDLGYLALGIELELDGLSMALGPQLQRACEDRLGSGIYEGLRFIHARTEHAALQNYDWLEILDRLLTVCPELGEPMALVGCEAVDAMLGFFGECIERGRVLARPDERGRLQAYMA